MAESHVLVLDAKAYAYQQDISSWEKKAGERHEEALLYKLECETSLNRAIPHLEAAQEAVESVSLCHMVEMRTFNKPPPQIIPVLSAVMCFMYTDGNIPEDLPYTTAQQMFRQLGSSKFIETLRYLDKENVHPNCLKAVQEYLKTPEHFDFDTLDKCHRGVALLSRWLTNTVAAIQIINEVKPSRVRFLRAEQESMEANQMLSKLYEMRKEAEVAANLSQTAGVATNLSCDTNDYHINQVKPNTQSSEEKRTQLKQRQRERHHSRGSAEDIDPLKRRKTESTGNADQMDT